MMMKISTTWHPTLDALPNAKWRVEIAKNALGNEVHVLLVELGCPHFSVAMLI
jgi:hypothetical protein